MQWFITSSGLYVSILIVILIRYIIWQWSFWQWVIASSAYPLAMGNFCNYSLHLEYIFLWWAILATIPCFFGISSYNAEMGNESVVPRSGSCLVYGYMASTFRRISRNVSFDGFLFDLFSISCSKVWFMFGIWIYGIHIRKHQ